MNNNKTLPSGEIWPQMLQGSDEWFAARKGRATASQCKRIVTPTGKLSAQADAYARQLARESVLDDPLAFAGNKATDWGNEHEPAARDAFAELRGVEVHEVGFVTHREMVCVGCSPDGLIVGPDGNWSAGLEIKCPSIDTLVEWMLDGKIPSEHLPQIHASMVVTGLRTWHFTGYFPGVPLFVPPPAEWNSYTDKLADALEGFVIRYSEIRPKVIGLLTDKNKQTR
jgi:putative phage-type endonuclease